MEDYYQQIGRAGRDGGLSDCVLMHSDSDLCSYASNFYVGRLTEDLKARHMKGIDSMRLFANSSVCRRVFIMQYFEETPTFDRCGMCDNCHKAEIHKGDEKRDFSVESKFLLLSIQRNQNKGVKAVIDGAIELHTAQSSQPQNDPKSSLLLKWRSKTDLTTVLKGVLTTLATEGYASCETKSFQRDGSSYSAGYTSYTITPKGRQYIEKLSLGGSGAAGLALVLPVPQAVWEVEAGLKRKHDLLLERLRKENIDPRLVPKNELQMEAESGREGDWLKWHRSVLHDRQQGRQEVADAKEELFSRIMKWRSDTAMELCISPEGVMKESLVCKIAYMRIFSVESLTSAGLRIKGVETLSEVVHKALTELGLLPVVPSSPNTVTPTAAALCEKGAELEFPDALMTAPCPVPPKTSASAKLKRAAWEDSYEAFSNGMSLEAVALSSAKGIHVQTVLGHLLNAFQYGRPLNVGRLATQAAIRGLGPPSESDWRALDAAAARIVERDPTAQPWAEAIASVVAEVDTAAFPELADLFPPFQQGQPKREYTVEQAALRARWFQFAKWWQALRSCGYVPQAGRCVGNETKKARL